MPVVAEASCSAAPEKSIARDLSLSTSAHDSGKITPVFEVFATYSFSAGAGANDDLLFLKVDGSSDSG